jgi:hypothetical protein
MKTHPGVHRHAAHPAVSRRSLVPSDSIPFRTRKTVQYFNSTIRALVPSHSIRDRPFLERHCCTRDEGVWRPALLHCFPPRRCRRLNPTITTRTVVLSSHAAEKELQPMSQVDHARDDVARTPRELDITFSEYIGYASARGVESVCKTARAQGGIVVERG